MNTLYLFLCLLHKSKWLKGRGEDLAAIGGSLFPSHYRQDRGIPSRVEAYSSMTPTKVFSKSILADVLLFEIKVGEDRPLLLRSPDRKKGLADLTRETTRIKDFRLSETIVYSYARDIRFVLLTCWLLGFSICDGSIYQSLCFSIQKK
jgi:hypothetical protein